MQSRCTSAQHTTRRRIAAILLAAAALIHAFLTTQHIAEGATFGAAFALLSVVQLAVAAALIFRPAQTADQLARNSLVVLIALYLLARVVPVPGSTRPEEASILGAFTVFIEAAALIAIATLPRPRPPRLSPGMIGAVAAVGSAVALLLVTSSLRYISADLSTGVNGGVPALIWRDKGLSTTSPQLTLYLTNHIVVFGSLLTLTLIGVLAAEIGIGAGRSRAAVRAGAPEHRHWFWIPAFFAAPVCCGAPLLGIVGPAVFTALLRWGWLPLLIAVSLGGPALAAPRAAARTPVKPVGQDDRVS